MMTKKAAAGLARSDSPQQSWSGELGPLCLSVPGCRNSRLPFHGYCAVHAPTTRPLPPTSCNAPLRCYCGKPECMPELTPPSCELPSEHQAREAIRLRDYRRKAEL